MSLTSTDNAAPGSDADQAAVGTCPESLVRAIRAEVRRGGKVYVQEYERGKPTTDVKEIGLTPGNPGWYVTRE